MRELRTHTFVRSCGHRYGKLDKGMAKTAKNGMVNGKYNI